jgi:hypothetical protein
LANYVKYVNFFKSKKNGRTVNNCHKLSSDFFERDIPDESFFFEAIGAALAELKMVNPKIKICFTVSPVRHMRHGAVTNARSKARLVRLCEMLCDAFDNTTYLPVYEFVLDELRDYRFYRHDDLIHLNEAGMEMLRERLLENIIDPACVPLLQQIEKLNRMEAHDLFHPKTAESLSFIEKRQELAERIERSLGRKFLVNK